MRSSNPWLRPKVPTLSILALDVLSFKTLKNPFKVKNPFLCLCCACMGAPVEGRGQLWESVFAFYRRLSSSAASTVARRAVSQTPFCIFLISFMLSVLQNPLSEALVCSSSLSLKIGCWEIGDPEYKMSPTLHISPLRPR